MQENENLKQQMHYYDAQMKTNIENDKKIRAIRHDMKHHIREINSLAEAGKLYELKKYSDELMGDINGSETVFNTGNITLDGIFNYYNGKFKDKCIETDINVVVPENMGISAMDINIIMGNLLDNAYENAIKVKDSYIKVNVKYNGNMLYIYVSNYIYLNPLFTLIGSAFLLGERLTMVALMGAVLILGGVYWAGKR